MINIKRIYNYITMICFIIVCILINLNILTVTTMILSAVTLSILLSEIFFDFIEKTIEYIIFFIIMLPINMFISYRVLISRDYNACVEYIIFFAIMFLSLVIISIKKLIKTKKSKSQTVYKSDFKEYVKLFIAMILALDIFVPMIAKQIKGNELIIDRIKIAYMRKDKYYYKDSNDKSRKAIEDEIRNFKYIKRLNTIQQLNLIKETAREGQKNYIIDCSVEMNYGHIIVLNDNKVYLKIKKENTFLNGMIGMKNDYYILDLSDRYKEEINQYFQE